jgi:hypothetical protein
MKAVEAIGQISVAQAFSLLKLDKPIFIASAPEGMDALPLRGAWKDCKGNIHYDRWAFYLQPETAIAVARAFLQDCIVGMYPNTVGNGRVYLFKDHIPNRTLALRHTGGYVADGEHLLVACLGNELPFGAEVLDSVPADLVLTFVVRA